MDREEQDLTPSKIADEKTTVGQVSRRNLLTVGTGVAAAAAVLPAGSIAQAHTTSGTAGAATYTNTFPQPDEIPPGPTGNTDLGDFHVHMSSFSFCDGKPGMVRSYNGYTPGPTILADSGRQITLTLYNNLPKNPAPGGSPIVDQCDQTERMNKPHCFNTTNLHVHGLHVSPCSEWGDGLGDCAQVIHEGQPEVASDDVIFEIPPIVEGGKPQKFCIWLPKFHAPGTHWYHSHKHGSTAIQVANGLAGALIVRERHPIVPVHNDFIWLIQEVLPQSEDWKIYPKPGGGGKPNSFFLINGECRPTLKTSTGKTLRLRFINGTGTPRGFAKLQLVKCDSDPNTTCSTEVVDEAEREDKTKAMYLMAVDGITFYGHKPQRKESWDLSPGNRADLLVKFNQGEEGVYQVLQAKVDHVPAMVEQVLGYIEVHPGTYSDPDPQDIELPPWKAAPDYLQPIQEDEITGFQRIKFENPGRANFEVNGRKYSPKPEHDVKVKLGCTEAWELTNSGAGPGGSIPHPFHIHVNPFQLKDAPKEIKLMDTSGPDEPENWIWWDTIAIPPGKVGAPGKLVIWTRFWDYPGRFVLHCHILVHEDLGMMANVFVDDPLGKGAKPCQPLERPIEVICP